MPEALGQVVLSATWTQGLNQLGTGATEGHEGEQWFGYLGTVVLGFSGKTAALRGSPVDTSHPEHLHPQPIPPSTWIYLCRNGHSGLLWRHHLGSANITAWKAMSS